jgi:hypothetical protein
MAPLLVTLAQAKTRFNRAHSAALAAEPLCRPIFERWRAEMLAAGTGEPEPERAAMTFKLALAFEIPAERKGRPETIAGFVRPSL